MIKIIMSSFGGLKMLELDKDIRFIKGVGPSRVEILNKLNNNTVQLFQIYQT